MIPTPELYLPMNTDATPNHLLSEKSPYLQQHAYNPVEWYPWGEEAFERARREDKPIFLSIGYSTCHWCHVMERESFEDAETAAIMNERFINIKVDREERPDVDQVYMTAVQLTTRQGGWPLSAWLTPDLKPFYLGTYFPPRPAYGRPSFRDVLLQLSQLWTSDRERVTTSAETLTDAVKKISIVGAEVRETTDDAIIEACFQQLEGSYDNRHGGFGAAPKFPRPAIFEFLLRYYDLNRKSNEAGATRALQMTLHTARSMAAGGMYDQLGGGFARYSVDAIWRVPHFEKMLYDQGQLLATFADLYRITGDEELARIIRQTVGYLERDLMSPEGAFYSAEDADSEGEEGTFYVWTRDELRELLTSEEAVTVEIYYGITAEGNFEHGKNVLHTSATTARVAEQTGKSEEEVRGYLESAHRLLFNVRSTRVRPHRDEKILTSWNGLMISGLARAASALGEPSFATLATRAADYLIGTMNVDGRLKRRLKDGEVKIDGYLDDYTFLAAGLLDLYEATFDEKYLREAERLTREADSLFGDGEEGGYYLTSGDDPSVLVRSKSDHDGAEPSGNSVMALNLLRLGRIFHDEAFEQSARRTIDLFLSRIAGYPMMMPLMVAAAITQSRPPRQIVIAASEDEAGTRGLVRSIRQAYLPETALLFVPSGGAGEWLSSRAESIEGMGPVNGQAAAYVCENFVCLRPVTTFDAEAIG